MGPHPFDVGQPTWGEDERRPRTRCGVRHLRAIGEPAVPHARLHRCTDHRCEGCHMSISARRYASQLTTALLSTSLSSPRPVRTSATKTIAGADVEGLTRRIET